MDIKEKLLSTHSRKNSNEIIEYIGDNPIRMEQLMLQLFSKERKISQRAAMPVGDISRKNPDLIKPYLKQLVNNLNHPLHDAIIRNTIRIFQDIKDIPEELEGLLYEKCFHYLTSMEFPPAIKAFSTTVLRRIAHKFPDLKEELIYAIEEQIPHGSIGFKNRARKEIENLKNQNS